MALRYLFLSVVCFCLFSAYLVTAEYRGDVASLSHLYGRQTMCSDEELAHKHNVLNCQQSFIQPVLDVFSDCGVENFADLMVDNCRTQPPSPTETISVSINYRYVKKCSLIIAENVEDIERTLSVYMFQCRSRRQT